MQASVRKPGCSCIAIASTARAQQVLSTRCNEHRGTLKTRCHEICFRLLDQHTMLTRYPLVMEWCSVNTDHAASRCMHRITEMQ